MEKPYIEQEVVIKIKKYNPKFGDNKICKCCGHSYYRHFDSYNDNSPVGCKYCSCVIFRDK